MKTISCGTSVHGSPAATAPALRNLLACAPLDPAGAAQRIVELLLPVGDASPHLLQARSRARAWLTLLLQTHPGITLAALAQLVYEVGAVTSQIHVELNELATQLRACATVSPVSLA